MKHIIVKMEVTEGCDVQQLTLIDVWREEVVIDEFVRRVRR